MKKFLFCNLQNTDGKKEAFSGQFEEFQRKQEISINLIIIFWFKHLGCKKWHRNRQFPANISVVNFDFESLLKGKDVFYICRSSFMNHFKVFCPDVVWLLIWFSWNRSDMQPWLLCHFKSWWKVPKLQDITWMVNQSFFANFNFPWGVEQVRITANRVFSKFLYKMYGKQLKMAAFCILDPRPLVRKGPIRSLR